MINRLSAAGEKLRVSFLGTVFTLRYFPGIVCSFDLRVEFNIKISGFSTKNIIIRIQIYILDTLEEMVFL